MLSLETQILSLSILTVINEVSIFYSFVSFNQESRRDFLVGRYKFSSTSRSRTSLALGSTNFICLQDPRRNLF
jgi:hypothetical protein